VSVVDVVSVIVPDFLLDLIWQLLYWKVSHMESTIPAPLIISWSRQFLLIDRRAKIESGQRATSFSFLLNNKRGLIGRVLSSIPPDYREVSFMGGQLGQFFFFST